MKRAAASRAAHVRSPCRGRASTTSRTSRVEIPRDSLVVVTGLSGSGKSSLAFDTIYAEGQRRYMESLSSYAKRFVAQVSKPDVDFVFGLSPVISIEQKTLVNNPRSTVGTMTDIASYLNLLFATIGQPHCPRTGEPAPSRSISQIVEAILSLPDGAEIELRAPVFKVYGEDLDFVFTEIRKKGCRRLIVDGRPVDISESIELDVEIAGVRPLGAERQTRRRRQIDAVVDRFVVSRKHEKAITAGVAATLLVGDGLIQVHVVKGASKAESERFYKGATSATHHFVYGDIGPEFFVFNNPESACRTCGGLGVDKLTHPELLVPDPKRSILGGCFVARGVQVQPRHLGRPGDVQPVAGARSSRSTRRGRTCRKGPGTPSSTASTAGSSCCRCRRTPRSAATIRKGGRSASTASHAASSAITAATGSAAKRTRGWKRGSTR